MHIKSKRIKQRPRSFKNRGQGKVRTAGGKGIAQECCARGGREVGDAPRATHDSTWSSGARTASEEPSRSQRAPSPFRALPPRRDRQRFQLAPTWSPAAAGSRATSQPSGLSLPWMPKPCRSRAARAKAPGRRGAAASHWRPWPWRRKGNAS